MTDYTKRRRMMVDTQVRPAEVTKFPIIDAMLTVERERFVPANWRDAAYIGENIEIGEGRIIFEPRTLAKMLDHLEVEPDDLALHVGCGYGYGTAVLARMAEAVVAVEEDEALAREAEGALSDAAIDNAAVVTAPLVEGCPKQGPYDIILVEGGVEELPAALTDQLAEGGRIGVLFMEGRLGTVRIGHRIDGAMTWRPAFNAGAPVLPDFVRRKAFAL